jgi:hypothetical protein
MLLPTARDVTLNYLKQSVYEEKRYWSLQDEILAACPVVRATLICARHVASSEMLPGLPLEVWLTVFTFFSGVDCYTGAALLAPTLAPAPAPSLPPAPQDNVISDDESAGQDNDDDDDDASDSLDGDSDDVMGSDEDAY